MGSKYTYELCMEIAKECRTKAEFRRLNGSAHNVAMQNGWLKDYIWFVDGRKMPWKWNDEKCIAEARKYTRKVDFMHKSPGAYHYAARYGLLPSFIWFENCAINLEHAGVVYACGGLSELAVDDIRGL